MTTQTTAERFRDAIESGSLTNYEAVQMAYFTAKPHPKMKRESLNVLNFVYDDKSLLVVTKDQSCPKAYGQGEY